MVLRRSRKRGNRLGPFKSQFEKDVALLFYQIGVEFTYESDLIPYIVEHNYNPDFKIGNMYIETKGLFTTEDRRKHLCIKQQHPNVDIRFIFQRDNKISKKSETRYSDWCKRYGFHYHIGESIPASWLKDAKRQTKKKTPIRQGKGRTTKNKD